MKNNKMSTTNLIETSLNTSDNQKCENKKEHGHNRSSNKNFNNNKYGNHGNHQNKRKNKHDRQARKRSKSFSGCGIPVEPKPVPPTKFLLGGNINDPLNLNSLQDEEINRAMNAFTPKSSPLPTPPRRKGRIEVMNPPNMPDPLHLIDCENDAEYEQTLCQSPVKKGRKKRINKKRRTISGSQAEGCDADMSGKSEAKTPELVSDSARIPDDPVYLDSIIKKPSKACKDLSIDLDIITNSAEKVEKRGEKTEKRSEKPEKRSEKLDKPEKSEKITKKERAKRKSEEGGPHTHVKKFKNLSMDKIVSPVIPQPGAWLKRTNSVNKRATKPRQNVPFSGVMPQFKDKNKKYQYGNYNRYYGYRNPNNEIDYRLKLFSHHQYIFENKDILDIGCNIGHITLCVARDFGARSVLGVDIDPQLISIARKNIKHYVKTTENSPRPEGDTPKRLETTKPNTSSPATERQNRKTTEKGVEERERTSSSSTSNKHLNSEFFPISMPILYGAIDIPGFHDVAQENKGRDFPNNVVFKQCNYVPEDESLLALEQPQYDTILCLSITKWIHLNWGDEGIKLAFRRMYEQLRPGGKLILEPQYWASYKSKRKLTEKIYKNFHSIEFFPEKFTEYLLSPAVGFAKSEILGLPHHKSTGFRRPIQVFTKSTMFPSERLTTGSYHGQTDKYESRMSSGRIEHVYATVIPTTYCPLSLSSDRIVSSDRLSEIEDASVVPTKYCPLGSERITTSERLTEGDETNIVPTKYCPLPSLPSIEVGVSDDSLQSPVTPLSSQESTNSGHNNEGECKNCTDNVHCECQSDSTVDQT